MVGVSKIIPPSRQILKDIYLSFYYGAKIGIIGMNGSGKSTLLKIIAGLDQNYVGKIESSKDFSVGYLEQEPILDDSKTVIEIVREGVAETMAVLEEYNQINDLFGLEENYSDPDKMDKLMDRQAALQDKIDACGAWELDTKLEIAMDALRTPDADTPIKVLSGGEKRRVALCRLLLQQPDVLLLDEPTNHLDVASIQWLENFLASYNGTVIFISHDRAFIDRVATRVVELDRGILRSFVGSYSQYLIEKPQLLEAEAKQNAVFDKKLAEEEVWIRQGIKARRTRNEGRVRALKALRMERGERREKVGTSKIQLDEAVRSGKIIFEGKSKLQKGIYTLVSQQKSIYFDFFVDENSQNLEIETEYGQNLVKNLTSNSKTQNNFFDYIRFIGKQGVELQEYKSKVNPKTKQDSLLVLDKQKSLEKAAKEAVVETFKVDVAASTATWVGIKKIGDKHTGHVKIKEGKVEFKEGSFLF